MRKSAVTFVLALARTGAGDSTGDERLDGRDDYDEGKVQGQGHRFDWRRVYGADERGGGLADTSHSLVIAQPLAVGLTRPRRNRWTRRRTHRDK